MSTFSRWNGPGDGCDNNPYLMQKLIELKDGLENVKQRLDYAQVWYGGDTSYDEYTLKRLRNDLNGALNAISLLEQTLAPLPNQTTSNTNAINALNNLTSAQGNLISTLQTQVAAIEQDLASLDFTTEAVTVKKMLISLGDIQAQGIIDFTKWYQGRAFRISFYDATIANAKGGFKNTQILGMLSENYVDGKHGQWTKPARAYITLGNTQHISAIVDMAAIETRTPGPNWAYDIYGVIRPLYAASTTFNVVIGLYASTDTAGDLHMYLGTQIGPSTVAGAHPVSELGDIFNVTGENFIPTWHPDFREPNNGVDIVTEWFVNDQMSISYDNLEVNNLNVLNTVKGNNFVDSMGHNIAHADETQDTLTLGTTVHNLVLNSEARPTVVTGSGTTTTTHSMAFLSDLNQSLFYQRQVQVIVDLPADLTGLTEIWFDASGSSKYVFATGDVALVKGYSNRGTLGDKNPGYFTYTLGSGWAYDANLPVPNPTATEDFSYQWAGPHQAGGAGTNLFMRSSYVVWTPNERLHTGHWEDHWSVIDLAIYILNFPVGAIISSPSWLPAPDATFEPCDGGATTAVDLKTYLNTRVPPNPFGGTNAAPLRPVQSNSWIKAIMV